MCRSADSKFHVRRQGPLISKFLTRTESRCGIDLPVANPLKPKVLDAATLLESVAETVR